MFQHALIRPAKNERVRFVAFFHIFLLGINRCQNVLISLVEINVLFCLALKPDQNGRVRVVALSVFVVDKQKEAFTDQTR